MSSNLITAPMTAGSSLDKLGMSGRELSQGMVIGRYVILGRVGTGGAGSVYSAYDTQLDRRVALKVLHGGQGDTQDSTLGKGWTRLVREARILGKLSHPNVVTIFDLGTEAGVTFIAMELVEGIDLSDWLEARRDPS